MSLIGALVSIVYRALFISGETGFRTAHPLSKLAFIASFLILLVEEPGKAILVIPVVALLGIVHPGYEWLSASFALSGLVGVYMGVSAYILSLLGLYEMRLFDILVVALRTFSISSVALFIFIMLSPIEFYNILVLIGLKRASSYPLLIWRMTPQALRNFVDSMSAGYLKGEKTLKRVPAAVASVIEMGRLVNEYCYWRLKTSPKVIVYLSREPNYTYMLLASSLIIVVLDYISLVVQ